MTIYEQIQRSVDFIERNLFGPLSLQAAATQAFLSTRSFHTYFSSITGFTFKEYVKKRRLSRSTELLRLRGRSVLSVALEVGYESHEAFSRAFKAEFFITPKSFQSGAHDLVRLGELSLIKELYMGVLIKHMEEQKGKSFSYLGKDPEERAFEMMEQWCDEHLEEGVSRRVFGHNIDSEGQLSYDPENEGYRMILLSSSAKLEECGVLEKIGGGRFAVTGIEGNFRDDPDGKWIKEGWMRMRRMMEEKGYRAKEKGRWFEEHLEPSKVGNLRLDLYVELENE